MAGHRTTILHHGRDGSAASHPLTAPGTLRCAYCLEDFPTPDASKPEYGILLWHAAKGGPGPFITAAYILGWIGERPQDWPEHLGACLMEADAYGLTWRNKTLPSSVVLWAEAKDAASEMARTLTANIERQAAERAALQDDPEYVAWRARTESATHAASSGTVPTPPASASEGGASSGDSTPSPA